MFTFRALAMATVAVFGASCSVGGSVPFGPIPGPAPNEIDAAMNEAIESFDREIFSFGGAVATCAALSCALAGNIYVSLGAARARSMNTTGFEFVEEREGVPLAVRDGHRETERQRVSFRSLAGWMRHSLFRVDRTVAEIPSKNYSEENDGHQVPALETLVTYDLLSTGVSTGTGPTVTGSASWSGAMAGVVTPSGGDEVLSLVTGDSRITIPAFNPKANPWVDIEFTNIVNEETGARLRDLTWEGVEMKDGAFGFPRIISPIRPDDVDIRNKALNRGIFGQFYGPAHEEVGGVFIRDDMSGVFGARREE